MCGRFTRSTPPAAIVEELREELGVDLDPDVAAAPRFNVCPSENVLVVARAAPGPGGAEGAAIAKIGWMKWGLVPWFAHDPKSGPRSINARAETLATNRTFRDPFQRRRCLIVADGFYEWRRIGSERHPMFFRLRSRRPFVFAGVWDRWKPREGEPLVSCAIVTCPPNGLVAPIHDRMPVIVPPDERAHWLAADAAPADLAALLRPYPESEMEAYAVSRLVNTPKNDMPECVEPVEPAVDAPRAERTR
jgi:putative SOS response-associated peptidase YedK